MTYPSDLINLLSSVTAALSSAQDPASVVGEGVAADGLIVVWTGLPGRVTGIDLDPAVAQLPVEELAAALLTAVNSALADLQAQAGLPAGGASLDALSGQLQEIQQQTSRQFSAFTGSLLDAQAALARRAGEPR
ncbi:YbaB/EbfC family nucleoid-associated protein [Asanoa sp. WMMD1127]|uniref:YbaB/EbfC family nucleoid-associated protein n=1 Tax=Asanoa sp. WMMD1127 TaxID=3016107 RepID=UPI002415EE71|nr:YbaB/EbfC family nucleoid-associated protein [Asanoa sp. WMMD1127]MDG4820617.1 YbaB/EbfC family nucleoid-associated protein [Asanoa sp. WMMD1127]